MKTDNYAGAKTITIPIIPLVESSNRASREDQDMSKVYDKLKWVGNSFKPFKSPRPDGTISALTRIFRTSVAIGYRPMKWRHVREAKQAQQIGEKLQANKSRLSF